MPSTIEQMVSTIAVWVIIDKDFIPIFQQLTYRPMDIACVGSCERYKFLNGCPSADCQQLFDLCYAPSVLTCLWE